MPIRALFYGWTTVAAGIGAAVGGALSWRTTDPSAFLVCLALAVLASTFKVKLPGLTGTISPAFVFVLVAVGQFSWSETVAISAISALVQSTWRSKSRPRALQLWFNAATLTIAGGLAHGVAHGLIKAGTGEERIVFLAVAGLVLLVSNTLLVSIILCLIKETPLHMSWRSLQTWAVPYYLAGGVLASVWAEAPLAAGAGVAVMAALSVYLLSVCYRGFLGVARMTMFG